MNEGPAPCPPLVHARYFHNHHSAMFGCRRNIEVSPLCQVEMAPSPAVLLWGAGCVGDDEQARVRPARGSAAGAIRAAARGRCLRLAGPVAPAGVPPVAGHTGGWCGKPGVQATGQAEQPAASGCSARAGAEFGPRALPRLRADACGREAGGTAWLSCVARNAARLDGGGRAVAGPACPPAPAAPAAAPARVRRRARADRWLRARLVRGPRPRRAPCWRLWTTRPAG